MTIDLTDWFARMDRWNSEPFMADGRRQPLAWPETCSGDTEDALRRTRVVVTLAEQSGGALLARSQARNVLAGLYRFREVIVDFSNVQSIGPAFADEIFRVYARAKPDVEIVPINMNEDVTRMMMRATRHESPPADE